MQNKNKNVLLTGGHAGTTALSVIEEIKSSEDTKDWDLFWIGARRAIEGKNIQTLESQILPKLGVTCYALTAGRLQRRFTLYTIPSLLKIPIGFLHALFLLLRIQPSVVLSFGGFTAFPVVVMSWLLRIPVIVHEQTAAAGRSNLASAFFAKKIAISRQSSLEYFPQEKCVVTGNPAMKQIENIKSKNGMSNPPMLFVTGGSRGSHPLNETFLKLVPDFSKSYKIVHQTGELDYEDAKKVRQSMPLDRQENYEVYASINPKEMISYYEKADIILARSGANTVSEVLSARRPTLFVPLPFAYNDEQTKNAEFAVEFGIAEILPQDELNAERLEKELNYLYNFWSQMMNNVKYKESPDRGAAGRLLRLVKEYV